MVTTAEALEVLFPAAVPLVDYVVADDGTGPVLVAWHLTDPRPAPDQLAAVTPDQVAGARLAKATAAALAWLAGSTDPVAVLLRVCLRDLYTRDNDDRERHGLDRVGEPDTVARLLAAAQAGAGGPLSVGG